MYRAYGLDLKRRRSDTWNSMDKGGQGEGRAPRKAEKKAREKQYLVSSPACIAGYRPVSLRFTICHRRPRLR